MLYGNYYYFLIKKTFSNVLSSPRLPRAHFETRARADKRVGICYTRVLWATALQARVCLINQVFIIVVIFQYYIICFIPSSQSSVGQTDLLYGPHQPDRVLMNIRLSAPRGRVCIYEVRTERIKHTRYWERFVTFLSRPSSAVIHIQHPRPSVIPIVHYFCIKYALIISYILYIYIYAIKAAVRCCRRYMCTYLYI